MNNKRKECKRGHDLENNRRYNKQGVSQGCLTCHNDFFKNYKRKNKYCKDTQLKHKYGITLAEYNTMLKEQHYRCAICTTDLNDRNANFVHLDHCHTTGRVRGILCRYCNNGIGLFKDNIDNLQAAINYLNR